MNAIDTLLNRGKLKVVLVDDNTTYLDCLKSFVENSNKIQVIATETSGIRVLKNPELPRADLLLMDLEMPGMNGIDTGRVVNFIFPHIKMIAVTIYNDNIYQKMVLRAGFSGFVCKEKLVEDLFRTIDSVTGNYL